MRFVIVDWESGAFDVLSEHRTLEEAMDRPSGPSRGIYQLVGINEEEFDELGDVEYRWEKLHG